MDPTLSQVESFSPMHVLKIGSIVWESGGMNASRYLNGIIDWLISYVLV